MSRQFAVVYEADADFRIASTLTDRVICETVDWIDPESLNDHREWRRTNSTNVPFTWRQVKDLAKEAGIKAHGHFNGQPSEADAVAARRAIELIKLEHPDIEAIVLIRDQDNQPERRIGLEQARADRQHEVIIIGLAVIEAEAWLLSGFEPENSAEESRLQQECDLLKFDPRLASERLTAKSDHETLSPKRVLSILTNHHLEREKTCLTAISLELLHNRGANNGLRDFLTEIRDRLIPLFQSLPPR